MASDNGVPASCVTASSALAELVDRLTGQLQAGQPIDWDAVARQYPEHADELRRLGPALGALEQLSRSADQPLPGLAPADAPAAGVLGDFRIVREVGRGGMGVVYEAVQVSLGRRVALKVLPFAATMDARHLQRFKNEAQAAAGLHHTNIVPVYAVGCERGVHYYAMQYIEGRTLAHLIADLRGADADRPTTPQAEAGPACGGVANASEGREAAPGAATPPVARLSTVSSVRDAGYYRGVARHGIQAAEALDCAHRQGVVHRDVKPANLMVDGQERVWVMDFGLAQVQSDTRLTLTGDLVGTLRYMSPEQTLAKRVVVDHRTDVYSLGATLYELLTLRPALDGRDREELLRQITFAEPKAPRRLDKAIPAELETIVLKAMAKNPDERYQTAEELADDLRHYLEDRPIQARRPGLVKRVWKWCRRHKALVGAAAAVLLVAGLLAGGVGLWWLEKRASLEAEVKPALEEAVRLHGAGRMPEALSAARRAEGLLAGGPVREELAERVREWRADLEMVAKLEDIRVRQSEVKDGHFAKESAGPEYAAAFREYGIDVESLAAGAAAELIRGRMVPAELAGALDDWAGLLPPGSRAAAKRLLAISHAANPSTWRDRIAAASKRDDNNALAALAESADIGRLPTPMVLLTAGVLANRGMRGHAVELLWKLQRQRPDDFWVNHELASQLLELQPPRRHEAIRFYSVAVALRPRSPGAYVNLGRTLALQRNWREAEHAFRKAIALKEDYAEAHANLGGALVEQGKLGQAEEACRQAIALSGDDGAAFLNLGNVLRRRGKVAEAVEVSRQAVKLLPKNAAAYNTLGRALAAQKRLSEAVDAYHSAIALEPENPLFQLNLCGVLTDQGKLQDAERSARAAVRLQPNLDLAHYSLGDALRNQGRLDEAIAEYRAVLRLNKDCSEAHVNLGVALAGKGLLDEAIAEYRAAIRLKPDLPQAHVNLGTALRIKGRLDNAIAEFREAIRIKKDYPDAHSNLGVALEDKGRLDEAMAEYRAAIRINNDYPEAHSNLGGALAAKGLSDQAIAEFREAIRLKKDYPSPHYNLANVLFGMGLLDDAIAEFREAIRLREGFPEAHCNLGKVLLRTGHFQEAVKELRRGHELGSRDPHWRYPSAQWLRQAEALARLDARLPAFLNGDAQPADAGERLALAKMCQDHRKLYVAAAKSFAEAFAMQPALAEDLHAGHRYSAACAAALAGCSRGKDAGKLSDQERARLRQQGLDWLRADLAAWRRVLEAAPANAPAVAQRLQHWLADSDFDGVRGTQALGCLPEGERRDWQRLWQEVAEVRQRAAPPRPGASPRSGRDGA
jgi:tetratricopeptide (TPR) repeat protein